MSVPKTPEQREKRRLRQRGYRERDKIAKYGPQAAGVNMSGRHGKHARGSKNGRWNATGKIISDEGYVKVRVGPEHPLADPNGYAYEHLIVWLTAGNPAPKDDELIHHKNEDKTDNRITNLEVKTRSGHGQHHIAERDRDASGRLLPTSPLVDQEVIRA